MKYRKKPVVIEAQQFTDELKYRVYLWAQSIQMNVYHSFDDAGKPILKIPTLEGEMTCSLGDWIIRGVKGELYPCKPDIFEKTYEPVADETPAVITASDLARAEEKGRREGWKKAVEAMEQVQKEYVRRFMTQDPAEWEMFKTRIAEHGALLAEGKKESHDDGPKAEID